MGEPPASATESDTENALAAERWAQRKHDVQMLWQQANVEPRFNRIKEMRKWLNQHELWASAYEEINRALSTNPGITIGLLGDRGTGKTQLAVELIRDCCNQLEAAYYIRAVELGMRLRLAYQNHLNYTEDELMKQFIRPRLLVVDECQEKTDTDWERRMLTLLIDKRYAWMRNTVLIANCTEKQFKSLMGPAVIDRMYEGGGLFHFNWPSFREFPHHDSQRS